MKNDYSVNYFNWMYNLVCKGKRMSYRKILGYLHEREFTYTLKFDGNRAEDGVDLRYRYSYELGRYDGPTVAAYLDDGPCTVLEMMIALAIRCEETIMDDPEAGDRTTYWFWSMMESLGLKGMSDERFDERLAERIVDIFLNREYAENGKGGLFTVRHPYRDLRDVEIWCQMNWHLDEL